MAAAPGAARGPNPARIPGSGGRGRSVAARATYTLGLDVGTQSTKAVLYDVGARRAVAKSARGYGLLPTGVRGRAEQDPGTWTDAVDGAVAEVLSRVPGAAAGVAGIGVSGQQHGMVALDAAMRPVRPAKLWCDVEAAPEAEELSRGVGWTMVPSFTAPKVLWLMRRHPDAYARVARVLLPHDYVNWWLTGEVATERGDASGTGFLDPRTREWSPEWTSLVDPALAARLPPLLGPDDAVGTLRGELAGRWGVPRGARVSAGGGDNMMSALGVGAVREGRWVVSLGTSGTLFGRSDRPVVDPAGELAPFCDSAGGWLPLLCTLNCAVPVDQVCALLGATHGELAAEAAAEAAAGGGRPGALTYLPYHAGERTPNWPGATGVIAGVGPAGLTRGGLYRAAMEGATLSLVRGLGRVEAEFGVGATELVVVGGGARSGMWAQMVADAAGARAVVPDETDTAALGAALQAAAGVEGAGVRGYAADVGGALPGRALEPDGALLGAYREALGRFEELGGAVFGGGG